MEIRKMKGLDLEGVARLERLCFSQPWSRMTLAAELGSPGGVFLVAEEEGQITGYLGMQQVLGEGYIGNVAVDPQFRRRGVGSMLVEALIAYGQAHEMEFLTLEVRESNQPAISLYEKFGFQRVGKRPRFYRDPEEDALLMTHFFHQA